MTAVRAPDGAIRIDGRASERAWAAATRTYGFVQRAPRPGRPASDPTAVAVAFDDRAIYVLVEAFDRRPARVRGRLTRHDQASASDGIEVWLDPSGTGRVGYRFAVNARGVRADSRLADGGAQRLDTWDAAWDAAVSRGRHGYTVELRIPFSELRGARAGVAWGIQVRRRAVRLGEDTSLAPEPPSSSHPLEHVSGLVGLSLPPRGRRVAVQPYVATTLTHDRTDTKLVPRGGADLRMPLDAATTLRLTLLPDFGQVEGDPSELNLTAFETFRAERRQFFLEGQDALDFPLFLRNWDQESLYYPRRIGASPTFEPPVSERGTVEDYPTESTVLGAAQVVGERSSARYALLTAVTGPERARVVEPGATRTALVAPRTEYLVARLVRQANAQRSQVGAVLTHVARDRDASLREVLVDRATATGLDAQLWEGDIALLGRASMTSLQGTPAALSARARSATHYFQRPDARHVDFDPTSGSLGGWSAELIGGKLDGSPWRAGWGVTAVSPGFDPNDAGYLVQADRQQAESWLAWHVDDPGPGLRRIAADGAVWLSKTFGDEVTTAGVSSSTSWTFADQSYLYAGLIRRLERLDVTLLRGGPAFRVPAEWAGWWGVGTDDRRRVTATVSSNFTLRDERALTFHRLSTTLKARPSSAVEVSIGPSWARTLDELMFVTDEPHAILGQLVRDDVSLTLRGSWTIALGLSLECYAMPFIAAGTYHRFWAVAEPDADRLAQRLRAVDFAGADRFQRVELEGNVVLRWDYLPGSHLYLVWSHWQRAEREDQGRIHLERDLARMGAAPSEDSVMLKLEQLLRL